MNQGFGDGIKFGRGPVVQPRVDSRSEISGALGKESFSQVRGGTVQIALTDFENGEEFVALALPGAMTIVTPQPLAQKCEIVSASEQFTYRPQFIGQIR